MSALSPTSSASAAESTRVLAEFDGGSPGPTLIIIGGLHANEPAGLLAAERVVSRLIADARETDVRGRIVALVGHVRGRSMAPQPRYVDHDLNRVFTSEAMARAAAVEAIEARELLAAIEAETTRANGPISLVDLHTTSAAAPPFAFVEDALRARRLASSLPVPLVLGLEEELDGLLVDHVTRATGATCAVFESGQHDDPRSVDLHEAALWVLLDTVGCLPLDATTFDEDPRDSLARAAGHRRHHVYDIRHRQAVDGHPFAVTPGVETFDPVKAHRATLATAGGRDIRSPATGLVFMPNRQAEIRTGDDAFFVIRRVGRLWLHMSSALRRRPFVHAALRRFPGIHPHPRSSTALLVDPDIAAVLKRRVFHLLGYRLMRYGPEALRTSPVRVHRALRTLVQTAWRRLTGRGTHPTWCDSNPDLWIIDRHVLDVIDADTTSTRD